MRQETQKVTLYPLHTYGSVSEIEEVDLDSLSTFESKQQDLVSVVLIGDDVNNPFLDDNVANYYTRLYEQSQYECRHVFDPLLRWSRDEEAAVVLKLDFRIAFYACVLFVGLELNRLNLQQALSDDILQDLGLSTNDYNAACTIFLVCFLLAELPVSMMAKHFGVHRFVPFQMMAWLAVALSQCMLRGRSSFFVVRGVLAVLMSGLVPELVTALAAYYTSSELPVRLSWFWVTQSMVRVVLSLFLMGILQLRGCFGWEGWRYLFLLEGSFTFLIGVMAFRMLVSLPCSAPASWWSQREAAIIVNRVLRNDPTKGIASHRITLRQFLDALLDYDLWPIYLVGLLAYIPIDTVSQYLNITLRGFGWSTASVNLWAIPHNLLHIVFLLKITALSEHLRQRALVCLLYCVWMIPLVGFLLFWKGAMVNEWGTWFLCTMIVGAPYIHAICVSWVSRNAGSIHTRAVSAALYNITVQCGNAIASNIYRQEDAPLYQRGNTVIFVILVCIFPLLVSVKVYYLWRNAQKERVWGAMDSQEQEWYIHNSTDVGNKRLDFRFDS